MINTQNVTFVSRIEKLSVKIVLSIKCIYTQCYSATVLQYYSATVLQCYNTTVLQCYSATVLQCYSATVLQCYSATVLQCYSATVLQCYSATVLQRYSALYYSSLITPSHRPHFYDEYFWVLTYLLKTYTLRIYDRRQTIDTSRFRPLTGRSSVFTSLTHFKPAPVSLMYI